MSLEREVAPTTSGHPLHRAMVVIRVWIIMLITMMTLNAFIARSIVLDGWVKHVPYLLIAATGLVWLRHMRTMRVVIMCSSAMAVGVWLRVIELMFFDELMELRAKTTASSVWLFVGSTTLVIGFLNIIAVSRLTADEKMRP